MNRSVAINKLSEQMGLTSRTLRHWESEGLFKSSRDTSSGWRIYDENALLCIRITAVLRKIDIPIKDIKSVIANKSPSQLSAVVENKISTLKLQRAEVLLYRTYENSASWNYDAPIRRKPCIWSYYGWRYCHTYTIRLYFHSIPETNHTRYHV